MKIDCTGLWPDTTLSSEAHTAVWWELAGRFGGSYPLARPLLFAIRGIKPYAAESHELVHAPTYDDTYVLLRNGALACVFPGATHAYQKNSKLSPGGNVGSIRPGRYVMHDLGNGAEVVFHVKRPDGSDELPAWRDVDHDGRLSVEERQRAETATSGPQVGKDGAFATSILFHGGLEEPPDAKHHSSIGCLTAARKWRRIVAEAASDGEVDLILIDAWDLLPIVKGLELPEAFRQQQSEQAQAPEAIA